MDRAKAAVGEIMHRAGHHDTTVHEKVAPAVVNETIKKTRHEEKVTAVDREIHQDHYHTSIQPIQAREVLPEQHQYNVAAPQERVYTHGEEAAIKARLEQERAQFHSTRTEAGTIQTESVAPTIVGEHVHHHVHETIQPVVQKEVIQPSVVHTTVPIHEVHRNEPKIHSVTALPAVSLSEFQRNGGTLSGREERTDAFEGDPKPVSSALGGTPVTGATASTGIGHNHGHGVGQTGLGSGTSTTGHHTHVGTDGVIGQGNTTSSHTGTSGVAPHKSSLLNKLDPRVDSNNDGKPGFMK